MPAYHSRSAFEERMARRRRDPEPVGPLGVFYHVACLGDWRAVVAEQLRLLAHARLTRVTACVLGTAADAEWCRARAAALRVRLHVAARDEDPAEFEHPTLRKAHRWACDNPDGAVLYFHTKGVSTPGDPIKTAWRRAMAKHVIADWRRNLDLLRVADLVGANWQESSTLPHFCGNFWMARCDWLASLCPPDAYRRLHAPDDRRFAGKSWWRMHVECWIGSAPWHHVESHACRNGRWWEDVVRRLDVAVPGFDYEGRARVHQEAYEWVRFVADGVPAPGRVVELGSRDVNGSVRPLFVGAEYVGVDALPGPGVDVVADAADWGGGDRPFDLVVSTETLEHTPRAAEVCAAAFRLLRPGGLFVATAAGPGRRPHSAVDGGEVRPGEHYGNVTPDDLRRWLAPFAFALVDDRSNPGDVYALAVKGGGR